MRLRRLLCFPKDVQALEKTAWRWRYQPDLLHAVESVNKAQKGLLFRKISDYFDGRRRRQDHRLVGLGIKPNTDDMRAASSRTLMGGVVGMPAPGARHLTRSPTRRPSKRIYGERSDLVICSNADEALEDADVLAGVTEWIEFRSPDFDDIRNKLWFSAIFDGRNIYDPTPSRAAGLTHYSIGANPPARGGGPAAACPPGTVRRPDGAAHAPDARAARHGCVR